MTSFLCRTPQGKTCKASPQSSGIDQEIKSLLSQGQLQSGFTRSLDLIDLHVQQTAKSCVMILDEFHLLGEIFGNDIFSMLGKKIIVQKQVMYILASSAVSQAKEILKTKLNLLFGNFELVPVEPFQTAAADEFLSQRLGHLQLSRDHRSFIISVTNGNPFYLDVLTRILQSASPGADPQQAILGAFKSAIFSSQGVLSQYFAVLTSRLEYFSLKVLASVAQENRRIEEIASQCGISKRSAGQTLKYFIEEGLIEKRGVFYLCPDTLFSLWLISVQGERVFSSGGNFESREKRFEEKFQEWTRRFMEEEKRAVHLRLVQLLKSFDDDLIEFQNKWIKLPRFHRAEIELNGAIPHVIGCLSDTRRWKWVIYSDIVREQDVSALVESANQNGRKDAGHRKIILALRGMDPNATLLAKESKLWAWDLSDFNQLLETYGKQKVML